ncbi:MAG: TIGR02147 family protein [Myxococcota bacterium]
MANHSVARRQQIDVFQYLDYRAFLRDWYRTNNEGGRSVSYRAFSRRAGLRSPNYLKLVMDGDRNLSSEMAERFAKTCGLEDDGASFFVDLVGFNQAKTQTERNKQYARLTSFRRYRETHQLDIAHAAYHSAWYIPAIREMVCSPAFREDMDWIANQLIPNISRAEAKRAVETLLELGLLVRNDEGQLRQAETLISTGPEIRGLHIANYHRTMMDHAAKSMDLVISEERDISSLTLCVGEDGLRRLKTRVQHFRRELLEQSAMEDESDRVIQINFQLFPLSKELVRQGSE